MQNKVPKQHSLSMCGFLGATPFSWLQKVYKDFTVHSTSPATHDSDKFPTPFTSHSKCLLTVIDLGSTWDPG